MSGTGRAAHMRNGGGWLQASEIPLSWCARRDARAPTTAATLWSERIFCEDPHLGERALLFQVEN